MINAFTLIDDPTETGTAETIYPSLAVLPFYNFSDHAEEHHFGDCIQEEILIQLNQNQDLDVKSRTSTLPFPLPAKIKV